MDSRVRESRGPMVTNIEHADPDDDFGRAGRHAHHQEAERRARGLD